VLQPSPLAQSWLIGGGVMAGHPGRLNHLPGERGLATWRGPARTWRNRRGSFTRRSRVS
jgi:hypothetical protein